MIPVVVAMLAAALTGMLLAFRNTKSFAIFLLAVGILRFDTEMGKTIGGNSNLSSLWLLWLIVLCLFALVRERVFRHRPTAPEVFYGIFLLWCGIEACLSDNIAFAARMYLKLLYPLLVMLVIRLVVDGEQIASTLLRKSLLAGVISCTLIGSLTARIAPFVTSTLMPFLWFGAATADCAALMTMIALSVWRLHGKWYYLAFALLLGTTSLFGTIRTGVAATAIGISVFAILELGKKSLPVVLFIYVGSALAFVALPEMRDKTFFDSSRAHFTDTLDPTSVDYDNIDSSGRFTLWQTVLDRFFWENPVMGSGLGATQAWFYGGGYHDVITVEHSEYVRLLSDTGVVGLGLYLLMIGSCMVALWRTYRSTSHPVVRYLSIAAFSMFPAYMFCMGFDNVLNYVLPAGQYPFAFTGAAIGLSQTLRKQRRESASRDHPETGAPLSEPQLAGASFRSVHP